MATDTSAASGGTGEERRPKIKIGHLIPAAVFAVIAVFFAIGLTLNPKEIPSVLLGKPVPEFDLPPVQGRSAGLSSNDLRGQVSLVNVFASWCLECKTEHPFLMELAATGGIPLHGLNYKDKPKDAARWLDSLGDPYTRTGADLSGRVAIDWGVYGVPETFLVDAEGRIRAKHIGALNWDLFNEEFKPLIDELRKGGG